MPTIVTPTEIEDAYFSGDLVADASEAMPGFAKGSGAAPPDRTEWPAVTIGRPQCWDLAKLVATKGTKLPAEIRLLCNTSDFHLLQLACSFRAKPGTEVDWARFEVALRLADEHAPAIAFDIYPREVTTRIERDANLTFSPSLKFAGVEASVGSLSADITMAKIEPSVIAYGLMESTPAWDFTTHPQAPLIGIRFGYIIVQQPKGSGSLTIDLRIVANVKGSRGIFRAASRTESGQSLSVVACEG